MKYKKYILAIAGILSLLQCITGYAGTWSKEDDNWIYVKDDGSYAEYEWIQDNGAWYYCSRWGNMEKNTVVDGYYLGADGRMLSPEDTENPLYGEKVCGTCYMQVNSYKDSGSYYKAKVTLYDSSYYTNNELNYVKGDKIWIEHKNAYGTVTSASIGTGGDMMIEAKHGRDTYIFTRDCALYCPYGDEEQVLHRKIKDTEVMIPKDISIIYTMDVPAYTTLDTFLNESGRSLIPVFEGNRVCVFYEDLMNYAS